MKKNAVKIIFFIRMILWAVALGATIYWIHYSFKLYKIGILDVYEYASYFRPVFTKSLIVTFIAIAICYVLRHISDKIKYFEKYGKDNIEE